MRASPFVAASASAAPALLASERTLGNFAAGELDGVLALKTLLDIFKWTR